MAMESDLMNLYWLIIFTYLSVFKTHCGPFAVALQIVSAAIHEVFNKVLFYERAINGNKLFICSRNVSVFPSLAYFCPCQIFFFFLI